MNACITEADDIDLSVRGGGGGSEQLELSPSPRVLTYPGTLNPKP